MPHQGLNKAILIGTIDELPRLYFGQGKRARLTLRVKTTEGYRDADGAERERRAWHDVVVWGPRAEALTQIVTRGRRVAVEGRIVNASWDGSDGRRRYRTEIHATEVVLLDGRKRRTEPDGPNPEGDRDVA